MRAGDTMYRHEPNYEHYVFNHVMERITKGVTFLDIGANIGVFAIHAARRGARAIAIEARPSACALLLENARRLGADVELHPLAVSDHHGYAVLDIAADSENAAIRRHSPDSLADPIVAVGLVDELIGERQIDILKIDVEGMEYRALKGAERMLERSRPVITTEYHPEVELAGSGVTGAEYLAFLLGLGYGIWILERAGEKRRVTGNVAGEINARCAELGYHVDLWLER